MLRRTNPATRLSRWFSRCAELTVGALLLASVASVAPAQAAAPTNDNWEHATPVTSLPVRVSQDTTEATTDAVLPPQAGKGDHSVWFRLQLTRDTRVLMSTAGSSFDTVLRLYRAAPASTPDQWKLLATNDDVQGPGVASALVRRLTADQDYYLMVNGFDGASGMLKMTIRRPAQLTPALARFGVLDRVDGSAVLHGTVSSTLPARVRIAVALRQRVGAAVVRGTGVAWTHVSRTPLRWHVRVVPGSRSFRTGPARVVSSSLTVYEHGLNTGTFHFARPVVTLR